MEWRVERIEPPESVVTTQEAKDQLRIDADADDALVRRYIAAAQDYIEGPYGAGILLGTQRWALYLQRFATPVHIPLYPVQSIDEITYIATDATTQTLASDEYRSDCIGNPARVLPAPGVNWPSTLVGEPNAITVQFTGGFQTVPEDLRHAVLLLVSHMYEIRQPVLINASSTEVPQSLDAILGKYRVLGVA